MKVKDNIAMLEIAGPNGMIYPVLAWDENAVVLIDTAFPGQTEALEKAMSSVGFALKDITKIILTHHDLDHIGSAKIIQSMGVKVLAHEDETPYIQGDKLALKLETMEKRFAELTEGERIFYQNAKAGAPLFYTKVDEELKSGQILPYCGGIEIIHTPGHTIGHISLFFKKLNILITGDAANATNGILTGANPYYSHDNKKAEESFEILKSYNAKNIICYHGGLIKI